MPVKATCSDCGAAFAAAEHLYGKRVRCPSCGGAVDVPKPASSQPLAAAPLEPAPEPPAASEDPLAGDLSSAMQMSSQPLAAQRRPPPAEKLDSNDYRVIIYAVAGAGGILLLLFGAILLTKFLSDDGTSPNEVTAVADNGDDSAPAGAKPENSTSTKQAPAVDVEQEKIDVRATFDSYKKALTNKQGERAAELVDSGTLNYYQQMRDKALSAEAREVRAMSSSDKINVLVFRHLIPLAQLKQMDGRAVFVHSVNEGWTGSSAGSAEIGDVKVAGNSASAPVMARGRPTNLSFEFKKEEGKWRLNLLAQLAVADQVMKTMAATSGQDENAMVLQMLTVMSGKPPADDIWNPPVE